MLAVCEGVSVRANACCPAAAPLWPTPADCCPASMCRWPYIAALPEELPCGWALPPAELSAALAGLGSLADGWQPQVAAAAAAVQRRCETAAAAWGPELGGVTAAEVRWALGQVVSRCFGSGGLLQAGLLCHAVACMLRASAAGLASQLPRSSCPPGCSPHPLSLALLLPR